MRKQKALLWGVAFLIVLGIAVTVIAMGRDSYNTQSGQYTQSALTSTSFMATQNAFDLTHGVPTLAAPG